jgi:hypothetical protein
LNVLFSWDLQQKHLNVKLKTWWGGFFKYTKKVPPWH